MFRRESAFSELLVSTHFREKCKNINTRNHGKKEVESRKRKGSKHTSVLSDGNNSTHDDHEHKHEGSV